MVSTMLPSFYAFGDRLGFWLMFVSIYLTLSKRFAMMCVMKMMSVSTIDICSLMVKWIYFFLSTPCFAAS